MTTQQAIASDREVSETLAAFEGAQRRLCNLVGLAHRENLPCQEIPLALANKKCEAMLRMIRECATFVGSVA